MLWFITTGTFLWRRKCSTIQSCKFFQSDFLQNPYFSVGLVKNLISCLGTHSKGFYSVCHAGLVITDPDFRFARDIGWFYSVCWLLSWSICAFRLETEFDCKTQDFTHVIFKDKAGVQIVSGLQFHAGLVSC